LEIKTSAKANFFQLQFFQATAKKKQFFKFFFQQIENFFETVEKTMILRATDCRASLEIMELE